MLNLRQIDKTIFLSGGWQNMPKDIALLKQLNIQYVFDLQYTPEDSDASPHQLYEELPLYGISYQYAKIADGEASTNALDVFRTVAEAVNGWMGEITRDAEKRAKEAPKLGPTGKPKLASGITHTAGILIKCGLGNSRSPSALIYYLCTYKRMSYPEALSYIQGSESGRLLSDPNPYFRYLLKQKFPEGSMFVKAE